MNRLLLRNSWALLTAILLIMGPRSTRAEDVVLAETGIARLPIIAGSCAEPVQELKDYLLKITGAEWQVIGQAENGSGIFVGLRSDFPSIRVGGADDLGLEGFVLQSDERNVYLLGNTPRGVQHAVTTFLHGLGCRWFFPGDQWTVIPHKRTIAGSWHERQTPSFSVQREIWPGYGQNRQCREEWEAWNRHNRMGAARQIQVQHSGNGLRSGDFEKHPEWYAQINNERQPSKPCYSHPDVVQQAIQYALSQAAEGRQMISMSPPDGLGYCQCLRCLSVLENPVTAGQPIPAPNSSKAYDLVDLGMTRKYRSVFGTRPDGTLISVTSETLFHFVNQVAEAVAAQYADVRIGCYAYSAYAHPPTFKLHPNVYVQVSTQYRYTPLTISEQLEAWGNRTRQLGVREYYSVYQWDWDAPDPGQVRPDRLRRTLRDFHNHGVTAVNAEASTNWGPRGLGYYVASQIMWNVDVDVAAVIRDFYEQAFGPAAFPMQSYYARWYGPMARVIDNPGQSESSVGTRAGDDLTVTDSLLNLRAAYRDLSEAAWIVRDQPEFGRRIDHLRMYLHYLLLRHQLREAAESRDNEQILESIAAETVFGGRLEPTNMIHTRPLIGKRFLDRFRDYRDLLTSLPDENREGKNWRVYGTPPSREELDRLWIEDGRLLGIGD